MHALDLRRRELLCRMIMAIVWVHALVSLAASTAWPHKKRESNRQTGVFYRYRQPTMPNPVRFLSPVSIGEQKGRHENFLFLFRHSLPVSRPRASSHHAQTSWSAELPVPMPCTHFFYALNMIMAWYVGIPCSCQQTLQNKGDHEQLQQLAHNNKTFKVRERSRFQSPESGPKHAAGRLA